MRPWTSAHHLQRRQRPGEFVVVARPVQDGRGPPVESVLLEREKEFALDPSRRHSVRSQDHDEPVAPAQRRPDLVMPLLRAPDVRVAVPHRDAVIPEHFGESGRERPVVARARQEDFGGNGWRTGTLIAVVDGLKGFPEAIESVYPEASVQTCIVHLIRPSLA